MDESGFTARWLRGEYEEGASPAERGTVQVELRTMQVLIEHMLGQTRNPDLFVRQNCELLQYDASVLHDCGLKRAQWEVGRVMVRWRDETLYFNSEQIFGLFAFWQHYGSRTVPVEPPRRRGGGHAFT